MTTGSRFIDKAKLLVNGLENVVDETWSHFQSVLDRQTALAHQALLRLVAGLPSKEGYIDFRSLVGIRRRNQFLRSVAKVYANWQNGVLGTLNIGRWARGTPSWERSLGLHPHTGGQFLQRVRDMVVRRAHHVAHVADHFERNETSESLEEAKAPTPKIKAGVKVLSKKGMSKITKGHSKSTSTILKGLKSVINDQEKALLENVLRGMDELPRKHANQLYDSATGLVLKDALKAVADQFSIGEMSKKQLKLSVQTHIRAMVRRVAAESAHLQNIKGVKEYIHFVQVPATRKNDKPSASVLDRAFEIVTHRLLEKGSKGSGDSLGAYPGDKVIAVPFPSNFFDDVKKASKAAREEYLAGLKHG
jgi:hypothetical protein